MQNQKATSWGLFVILALLWGSSFILMKEGAKHLTGWQIGAIRILAASVVFLPFAIAAIHKIPSRKIPLIVLTGVLGNLFPAFLFGIAIQQQVQSSLAGILNSLTPLFVIVIGALFFKKQVPAKKVLGVLIGFGGLVLLSFSRGPITLSEIGFTLLILLATLFYGLNVNIITTYLKGVDPFRMATISIASLLLPTLVVLIFNPVSMDTAPERQSIFACVALGILSSSIATALYYTLIKKAGGLFASLVTYAVPVVAIFWGLLFGEEISPLQVGCLGVILGGVYLANK
ncbi:MAG TPA: DMT family transporter [Flavisolibacter sp.]|jgi:drug/metabolite transporter (DMT)-like permease|nr:DMT family transporter [Flavisolibacter sp.]